MLQSPHARYNRVVTIRERYEDTGRKISGISSQDPSNNGISSDSATSGQLLSRLAKDNVLSAIYNDFLPPTARPDGKNVRKNFEIFYTRMRSR